jgi:ABC-type Fe3+ transport system substrate-binding protein
MPSVIRGSDNFDTANLLGKDQSWQDLTSSRAIGTTYTNATGRPIQVNFFTVLTATLASPTAAFEINGVTVGWYRGSGASANMPCNLSFVIPNGATYRGLTASGVGLVGWSELR